MGDRHETGRRRLVVDEDGAGAAEPLLARDLRAGQVQRLAEHRRERCERGRVDGPLPAVDGERDHAIASSARASSVGSTWERYHPGASTPSRGRQLLGVCAGGGDRVARLDRAPAARRRLDRADRDAQAVVAFGDARYRDRVVARLAQRQPGVRGAARHRGGHAGDERARRRAQVLQRDLLGARGRRDGHGGLEREERRDEVGRRERRRRHRPADGRVGADGRVRRARGSVVQSAQARLAGERRREGCVRRARADPHGVPVDRDLAQAGDPVERDVQRRVRVAAQAGPHDPGATCERGGVRPRGGQPRDRVIGRVGEDDVGVHRLQSSTGSGPAQRGLSRGRCGEPDGRRRSAPPRPRGLPHGSEAGATVGSRRPPRPPAMRPDAPATRPRSAQGVVGRRSGVPVGPSSS